MATAFGNSSENSKLTTLNIDDLDQVLELLEKHGYAGTSYYRLGLKLGLSEATLKNIEKDHKEDTSRCLTECLSAWLRRVDQVDSKGGPTLMTLRDALRELGERAVADGIELAVSTVEKFQESLIPVTARIFESFKEKHHDVITNPSQLALDLFEKGLISSSNLHDILSQSTTSAMNYRLLKAIRKKIIRNPDSLYEDIVKRYIVADQHMSLIEHHGQDRSSKITMKVDSDTTRAFREFQASLGKLLFIIKMEVEESNVTVSSLTGWLSFSFHIDLKSSQSLEDIFDVIRKHCSPLNHDIPYMIAIHFNLTNALKAIEDYENEREYFRLKLSSSAFADELRSAVESLNYTLTEKNTLVLELPLEKNIPPLYRDITVSEFQDIMRDIFSDLTRFIHAIEVVACSVRVIMYAPERVIGDLVVMAKGRVSYLKEIGVTKLVIGDEVIILQPTKDNEKVSNDVHVPVVDDKEPSNNAELIESSSYELFSQILQTHIQETTTQQFDIVQDVDERENDGQSTATSSPPINPHHWRWFPPIDSADVIIIGSYGNSEKQSSQWYMPFGKAIMPKIVPSTMKESNQWMNDEINTIRKLYNKNLARYHIRFVCRDLPGVEQPRQYYLDRITELFVNCKEPGVTIRYTGHGEKGTGSWCFKDGVITFQDIFWLYMNHLRGKSLMIISDCSYSGQWINECVKTLDKLGIPSCGHHTRDQGILLKIFTSCSYNEEATALAYVKACSYNEEYKGVALPFNKPLSSGQIPCYIDFRLIRCSKQPQELCEIDSTCTWDDRLRNKIHLIYLVRGKDAIRRPAWHYVLVDENKVDAFKFMIAIGAINLAVFGKVLHSGFGKNPPEEIKRNIELRFCLFVSPP